MSGLDYSTFSLCSALTLSQPTPGESLPAGTDRNHVALNQPESVIVTSRRHMQRDDLPSSSRNTDYPRAIPPTLLGSYQEQALDMDEYRLPVHAPSEDPLDDIQGNILCAELGNFHLNTTYFTGHPHFDEQVNAPAAITETPSWDPRHNLHYPIPDYAVLSQRIKGVGLIAKDARLIGSSMVHSDVNGQVPGHGSTNMMFAEDEDSSYNFTSSSSSAQPAAVIGASFTAGKLASHPSPPIFYDEEEIPEAHWGRGFIDGEQSPAFVPKTARQASTSRLLPDRQTAQSLCQSREASSQSIMSLDHRSAAGIATPLPGHTSSQSQHDHPSSFGTAFREEGLLRPGSAPPMIDIQVPFIGDVQAALQYSENAVAGEHSQGIQQHVWQSPDIAPDAGPSPRSSPRRVVSIGHNSQRTPLGSRHLRRWSSVNNATLRPQPTFPFLRQPPADNASSYPPASMEALPLGRSSSQAPHYSSAEVSSVPPIRNVIRCDGYLVDDESLSNTLQKPDKLLHVYECFWDRATAPCGMWIEGDQSSVADHLAYFHGFKGGEVVTGCLWRDCPKPHMKGTSIARHVVTHLGFRVKCNTCKHEFARGDACNRAHSRSGCLGVGQPMYGDLQRVLDARKVDPTERPSKKRRRDD
ncbi:hypothetical protein HYDPIDRAFT_27322 [Hydnomerulius pinastri MD-312]|nr:hypothetical protein HYDPIDRAFT_27322 [Hydnomerulius pinastri MD-312]